MNKVTIGKINALSIYLTWFLLVLGMLIQFLSLYISNSIWPFSFTPILIFLFPGAVHAVLAFFVRCPHCSKCLTVEGFKKPHPKSRMVYIINGWGAVALQWFSGNVVCIHCGKEVNTNAL